jgi:hypothetical protein
VSGLLDRLRDLSANARFGKPYQQLTALQKQAVDDVLQRQHKFARGNR